MLFERAIKCHFYKVTPNTCGDMLVAKLVALQNLPDDHPDRVQEIENRQPVSLAHAEQDGPRWLIDLLRIRMDVDAMRASTRGSVIPVVLAEHEGMGEESSLLYDPAMRIMVIQSGRETAARGDIESYYKRRSNN